MARVRSYYRSMNTSIDGAVKYAIGENGKRIGFITRYFSDSKGRGGKRYEMPSAEFRRIVAQNLSKIEKKLGTTLLRTSDGHILEPLGAGYYGMPFRLSNGNLLKISKDTTEGGSALFWKGSQRKNPSLLCGSCKVYNVFSVKKVSKKFKKGRRYYYFIEREEVDVTFVPSPLRQYLDQFMNEFHIVCSSETDRSRLVYLKKAKITVEQIRRHAPGLAKVLGYGWDKGLPMLDADDRNVGIRIKKGIGGGAKVGQWVVFDFGGLSPRCFDLVTKDSKGRNTTIKGVLKKYCKKVPVLK